jgi:Uma2 family endonuclease
MTLEATLAPLLHSPRLPEIVQSLQARLISERAARKDFYEMADDQKLEFIDGEVIVPSPARTAHLICRRQIEALLDAYVHRQSLGQVLGEKCLCVFPRNDYEPDIVFFGPEKAGRITAETVKFPVPEMAVEVLSNSTEARDRGVKFEDYAANGVKEYWIVDADAGQVEQYLLRDGAYALELKSGSGEIVSRAIAGLRLPIRAFFDPQEHAAALLGLMMR